MIQRNKRTKMTLDTLARMTQEELAGRCNLHRTYVAGVERGIRNPSLKSIKKLADGLGLPPSDLFRRMGLSSKATRGANDAGKA